MTSKTKIVLISSDCYIYQNTPHYGAAERYIHAISRYENLLPVIVPPLSKLNLEALVDKAGGVLLTGATSNVAPHHYHQYDDPEKGPFDVKRDDNDIHLIHLALEKNKPLFAICRGLQELNVALGGSLQHNIQEIPGIIDHRACKNCSVDEKFTPKHEIIIKKESFLAGLLQKERLFVNSLHQQAIDRLSDQLVIEANAQDGIIEGVRVRTAQNFALGLQWHPEYFIDQDRDSQKIFSAFAKAIHETP